MMWELDYKESWVLKNWCFSTAVFEKTLESSLDSKKIQPVHPKGNQSSIFIDVEAETPVLWPPDGKSWLIWKDPDAGKDWRQVEKGTTEDEMVGWHHQLNGHAAAAATVSRFSRVRLFSTLWTAACQASISITNSQHLPKLMSIELVVPSNYLILCHPLLFLPSIFPSIWVFSNESAKSWTWLKQLSTHRTVASIFLSH